MKSQFKNRLINFLTIVSILFSINLQAQENEGKINKEIINEFVKKSSNLLKEKYIFPEVAEKISVHINDKNKEGFFDNLTDPKEFAEVMTEEMQSISNDKHMRVHVKSINNTLEPEAPNPLKNIYKTESQFKSINFGFTKLEKIKGNIGYLKLDGFAPLHAAKDYADLAMKYLSTSDAVIIDLRENNGGSPDLVQYICSYFFEEPTHLNSLYNRVSNDTAHFVSLEKVDGKKMPDIPLFVLTSSKTFSAGEEFAYNIQTQKRGTLIGETTGGGANPGQLFNVTKNLGVFIPTGMAINPITKTNWEGIGVKPDIETTTEEVLEKAITLAEQSAEKYKTEKDKIMLNYIDEINSKIEEAEKLFDENKEIQKVASIIKIALDLGLRENLIDEMFINFLGYQKLFDEKYSMAVEIFKYNVNAFPNTANTYDSLGEAYLKIGDKVNAIINYKKSLELDPENDNAKEMLIKLNNES
ncbi:d-alanyl-d-alanine carboxypeptidase [hydrocarbon metagenome]|uniref:D-alanyl-d-alanine carboxypeptidase n=1 Tax=hydrocarbon metagenome TaxID=938273 RepID=A0A0W8FWN8_9ZZZZ